MKPELLKILTSGEGASYSDGDADRNRENREEKNIHRMMLIVNAEGKKNCKFPIKIQSFND